MKSTSKNSSNSESSTPPRSFFKKPAEQSFFQNVQTKLTVGKPGDKYEVEADAMADKVVQRLQEPETQSQTPFFQSFLGNTALQTKCDSCEEEVQTKENEIVGETPDALQTKVFTDDSSSLIADASDGSMPTSSPVIPFISNTIPTISRSEPGHEEEVQAKEEDSLEEESVLQKACPESQKADAEVMLKLMSATIQTKCTPCAEDGVQRKEEEPANEGGGQPKFFFSSSDTLEGEVQRKRMVGESVKTSVKEGDKELQAKGNGLVTSPILESQLGSSKGNGRHLAKDTRNSMEATFGQDFSAVKIHTGNDAVQMNQELNALAFTYGSDIYFNRGKYNPESRDGQHLLAHELTHVVQQNHGTIQRSAFAHSPAQDPDNIIRAILPCLAEGVGIDDLIKDPRLRSAAVIFAQLNAMVSSSYLSSPLNILDPLGLRERLRKKGLDYLKKKLFDLMGDEVIELKGNGTLELDYLFQLYICLRSQKDDYIPVNVKFGRLSVGGITRIKATNRLGVYNAAPSTLWIFHEAFDLSETGDALALNFQINNNIITGELGITSLNEIARTLISYPARPVQLYTDKLDRAVLGGDVDNAMPLPGFGVLSGGELFLMHSALIDAGNSNYIISLLTLKDEEYTWEAPLELDVVGMNAKTFEIERTSSGLLSGEATDLSLGGSWTGKGFALEGELRASYLNGTFEIRGDAKYTSKRVNGKLSLLVTDEESARKASIQNLPEAAKVKLKETEANKDQVPKKTSGKMALTGWGSMSLNAVVGTYPLVAEASFVVDPDGYLTSAGTVAIPEEYFLTHTLFEGEKNFKKDIVKIRVPVKWGTVELSLSAGLDIGGMIGPLRLFNLKAAGFYSNNPIFGKTTKELTLSADLDIFGSAKATAALKAVAAIKIAGFLNAVEVGGELKGTAEFNAFIKASPSITHTTSEELSQYVIKGILHAGGELLFDLKGSIYVDVFRIFKTKKGKENKTWHKDFEIGKWTLGEFGFDAAIEHVLGSGELPSLDFNKTKFNRKALARAMKAGKKQAKKEREEKLTGGFKQEEEGKMVEKGTFSKENNLVKDPESGNIEPYIMDEPFTMNSKKHLLRLEISGTEEAPEVSLEMHSKKGKLLKKIDDEKLLIQLLLNSDSIMNSLTDDQEKILNKRIKDLKIIKDEALDVIEGAERLAQSLTNDDTMVIPGFRQLDDQINTYGERYETDDLGLGIDSPQNDTTPSDDDMKNLPAELTNLTVGDPIKEKEAGDSTILKFSNMELKDGEIVFMATTPGNYKKILSKDQYQQSWWLAPSEIRLVLPSAKAAHKLRYQKLINERLLIHSKRRPDRKTSQKDKWDRALRQVPHPTWKSPGPNAISEWAWNEMDKYDLNANRKLRPYWSKTKRYQHPMQVDHVVEWQVTPLGQADIYDDFGNFELLDQPTNSSSGNAIKNNVIAERQRLVDITGDNEWYTLDLVFTVLVEPSMSKGERWSEQEIESGEHVHALKRLLGEPE